MIPIGPTTQSIQSFVWLCIQVSIISSFPIHAYCMLLATDWATMSSQYFWSGYQITLLSYHFKLELAARPIFLNKSILLRKKEAAIIFMHNEHNISSDDIREVVETQFRCDIQINQSTAYRTSVRRWINTRARQNALLPTANAKLTEQTRKTVRCSIQLKTFAPFGRRIFGAHFSHTLPAICWRIDGMLIEWTTIRVMYGHSKR